MALDVSKAIDQVWSKGLLNKQPVDYGPRSTSGWKTSFRDPVTYCGWHASKIRPANTDVPQGSVLTKVYLVYFYCISMIYYFTQPTYSSEPGNLPE